MLHQKRKPLTELPGLRGPRLLRVARAPESDRLHGGPLRGAGDGEAVLQLPARTRQLPMSRPRDRQLRALPCSGLRVGFSEHFSQDKPAVSLCLLSSVSLKSMYVVSLTAALPGLVRLRDRELRALHRGGLRGARVRRRDVRELLVPRSPRQNGRLGLTFECLGVPN